LSQTAGNSLSSIFLICWVALGISSLVFYNVASLETKKRWHPAIMVLIGLLFLSFVALTGNLASFLFVLPFVALVTFLNIRNIRFCPKCGKTLYQRGWSRDSFCAKCGTKLDSNDQTEGLV
jgi:hypothetical protein